MRRHSLCCDGYKPDFVSPWRSGGHLSCSDILKCRSSSCEPRLLPEGWSPVKGTGQATHPFCFVLHRGGFVVPPCLRLGRWALTPPFHPCFLGLL